MSTRPSLNRTAVVPTMTLANHTWSHPHLNPLPLTGVADQIRRNAEFLTNTYGSDGSPFFRPPHGVHNPDVDQVAADAGYTTLTRWSADIGNSRPPAHNHPLLRPARRT